MLPRSAAGRAIVREVDQGAKAVVEQSKERFIVLKKKTRDSLLGLRFGLHPVSGQGAPSPSDSEAQLPSKHTCVAMFPAEARHTD